MFVLRFIIVFLCLLLLNPDVHAQTLLQELCSNSVNYTSKSQFQTNLNLLLQSLLSNGTENGFFNTSTGIGDDRVYGLVQCRADILMEDCQNCLNTSTVEITQKCSKKAATIQYDQCILRYSNQNFFSQVDGTRMPLINPVNVPDADGKLFNLQLLDLMKNLSSAAASRTDRFDSGSFVYNNKNKNNTYCMVQCRRDLSPTGCQSCLQSMISWIPNCCDGKQGARIFSTTCYVRYESYPFVEAGDVYLNLLSPSPPPQTTNNTTNTERVDGNRKGKSSNIIVIIVPVIASSLLFAICGLLVCKRTRKNRRKTKPEIIYEKGDIRNEDALQFDLNTIRTATNDFSDVNKLGQGGFGVVYKGVLRDGQEIAVKRLFKNSDQESHEFKNEVVLLHKLQHRNLVRLLGFCLSDEEKLLIYEFVPNTSLDKYIFDRTRSLLLDWERRYTIIGGVARGLVYLHEDSRLRIVHRDLKSGNILLDEKMNAKIADFGVAKLFGVDQTHGNTRRIAGTYGYMAPEYALHGLFSPKSDVYSFGVLVLEIISGQKTNNFHRSGRSRDLLSYTWKLWTDGNALQLMDPTLMDNYSADEVMRCIHIGLLCIQDNSDKRPTMSSIIMMLNSYGVALETPSAPALLLDTRTGGDDDVSDAESNDS